MEENLDEDKLYWVWLSLVFPASDKGNRVVRDFGPPAEFYKLSAEGMARLGFLTQTHIRSAKRTSLDHAKQVVEDCHRLKIGIVTYADPEYPERLRNIYAPPMVLYTLGDISGLDDEAVITMVGTRRESEYSNSICGWLAKGLSEAGAVIVSGCAVGNDSSALVGAMQGGGRTIGVLPVGLDVNYPKESRALKRQMLKRGGALISELPPGTPCEKGVFPKRNRIMAGLALGVVVTHAPLRSGSLITANYALENGRDVFCVPPYSIFDPQYFGVVEYLRQGATPVFAPEDVLGCYLERFSGKLDCSKITGNYVWKKQEDGSRERLKVPKPAPVPAPFVSAPEERQRIKEEANRKFADLASSFDENQLLVYNSLEGEPQYLDDLLARTSLSVGVLLSTLTELEILGVVRVFPGSRYGFA